MAATSTITLQSVTGVDVELKIAGAGSRSYAFVIDWHIRLILALAWLFAALFIAAGTLDFLHRPPSGRTASLLTWVPALLIYFFYHPVLETLMRGSTPGKRMAGVRIVSRSGDIPSVGALLIRNLFRIVDSLPTFYLLGLAVVIFTEQNVRIGDLAAGTLLVHDEADSVKSFNSLRTDAASSGLTPQSVDLIHELLDRWPQLDDAMRANLTRALLLRVDPTTSSEQLLLERSDQLRSRLKTLIAGN